LRFQFSLNDLLCVVPSAARVRHEDRLIKAEQCNRDEVTDKEIWLEERKTKCGEEDGQEDVEHALLRILSTNLDDPLPVFDRWLGGSFQFDVRLDEFDGAIRSRADRLR